MGLVAKLGFEAFLMTIPREVWRPKGIDTRWPFFKLRLDE